MASEQSLKPRFLIVEDEYYLADDARSVLSEAGFDVLGPMATIAEAESFLDTETSIDGVLLDVNLRGATAFGVADILQARAIPFAFVTGYDCAALPDRFAQVPALQKPASADQVVKVAEGLVVRSRAGAR
jgi:DNA-binding response OmpR family regulator